MKEFSQSYYELLTGEYSGINLTRIVDKEEFYQKQIIDSVEIYRQSDVFKTSLDETKLMVDIGFGGGFPILPMANLLKDVNFVGIETRNKKVKVVSEIAEKLNLSNVKLFHSRIESILIDKKCVCTLKAVGKVGDFLSRINACQKIKVFFYKGPNFYDLEKESLRDALRDWNIIEEKEISVPGTDKRLIIGFENKNVPHGTSDKNKLVKLSSIN
jgi:16S rRNA (guanine527-N7)-methyltransferase